MPTGAARSTTQGHMSPTRSETAGSLFDQRQPPTIPKGLRPEVRRHAKDILSNNVHLWSTDQVAGIVRLATLRADIEALTKDIDQEGFMLERKNGPIANPLIAARGSMMRDALALERVLGICFTSRGANVKKHELEAPAQPKTKPAVQGRVLKLA